MNLIVFDVAGTTARQFPIWNLLAFGEITDPADAAQE